jgi:hypothetical protein
MKTTVTLSPTIKQTRIGFLIDGAEKVIDTGIGFAFATFYQDEGETMTWVYEKNPLAMSSVLVQSIKTSKGRRLVNDQNKASRVFARGMVSDYATDNIDEDLVKAELEVLRQQGFDLMQTHYFAYPWSQDGLEGYLFLLADQNSELFTLLENKHKDLLKCLK